MTRGQRLVLFAFGALGMAGLLAWGYAGLPPIAVNPPYGRTLAALAVRIRHVQNAVSGVNYDLRAFDTLLEEFLLLAAATGVGMLLRRLDDEREQSIEQVAASAPAPPEISETASLVARGMIGPGVVVGLAIVAHGHLTPGGGFQGGALIVSAALLGFLAGRPRALPWGGGIQLTEVSEGIGAGGIIVLGLAGLALAGSFLQNFLPVGQTGSLLSAGLVPILSAAVGLAVASGVVLVVRAFVAEVLAIRAVRAAAGQSPADGALEEAGPR